MKILVAGDWHSDIHEEAVSRAFQLLGHEVFKFAWHDYFKPSGKFCYISNIFYLIQDKYKAGEALRHINRDFIALAAEVKPDLIFVYRGTHIYPETLKQIRQVLPKSLLLGYNNDDPFSPSYPWWMWRHFLKAVSDYDLIIAYRQHNIDEFRTAGAKEVRLLRSWFLPWSNYPIILSPEDKQKFGCDVVFIGHYEDDDRDRYLEAVACLPYKLKIFGPGWNRAIKKSKYLSKYYPIEPVRGKDYNMALNASRIALCFLSKLNRDTYTRRCFEIPATKTMMLAEYTDDLAQLYKAGEEADYFRSVEELVDKMDFYLKNDLIRERIAQAGYERVTNEGHDVISRMEQVLRWCRDIRRH